MMLFKTAIASILCHQLQAFQQPAFQQPSSPQSYSSSTTTTTSTTTSSSSSATTTRLCHHHPYNYYCHHHGGRHNIVWNNQPIISSSFHLSQQQQQQQPWTTRTTTKTMRTRSYTTPPLFSFQTLVDQLSSSSSSDGTTTTTALEGGSGSTTSRRQGRHRHGGGCQIVFVGGKGGVGKTTISSALAVSLASDPTTNVRVLIVSTDPAHSLGDALDEDLHVIPQQQQKQQNDDHNDHDYDQIHKVLTDPLTGGRLSACEVDATIALEEFQQNLEAFDIQRLANVMGVSLSLLESLGLDEFNGLLQNPPPGLDELVALSSVLDQAEEHNNDNEYNVIVVDTAPTGHTLRLLALPQFLDGFLSKLIQLRMKLAGIASTLQTFLGTNDNEAKQRKEAIDNAVQRLEIFRSKMTRLRQRLTDDTMTQFVIVTVPTKLGVAESKRLVSELHQQQVRVSDIVINQCVGGDDDGSSSSSNDAAAAGSLTNYYQRRIQGQEKWIGKLEEAISDVSNSDEYKSNGSDDTPIAITTVPFFDVELVGIPALAYVGSQIFMDNTNFDHLLQMTNDNNGSSSSNKKKNDPPKVVICGGKGGVGKTTTASSLAVSMAIKGHKVALISTDPAHSLGDAIDMNLKGGHLVDCPLIGVPATTTTTTSNNNRQGSLSVMEIDPTSALNEFKTTVDRLVGTNTKNKEAAGDDDGSGSGGTSGIGSTLRELQEVFDTLPAGTDEVVALAKIVNIIKNGDFDRIVLDTAPTGHTLRMLSTPSFLADLMERLLLISDKINSNSAIRLFMRSTLSSTSSTTPQDFETATEQAKSALLKFQFQMYDLEDLFSNPNQTEFLIVTIATELAVRESMRLLNDLTFEAPDMPIKVRNVIINQVLRHVDTDNDDNEKKDNDGTTEIQTFLSHVSTTQAKSILELEDMVSTLPMEEQPIITKVPYLDTEPRGVFGLKVLADTLLRDDKS